MAKNHGDNALPPLVSKTVGMIESYTSGKENIIFNFGAQPVPGVAGDEIGLLKVRRHIRPTKLARRQVGVEMEKSMNPPVGLMPDLLILQRVLIDLSRVVILCALVNSAFAWAYCIRYQKTFSQAWEQKSTRQLASLALILDLLCVFMSFQQKGLFRLAERSAAESESLSYMGSHCLLPTRPTKVRKRLCPPDPCPCDVQEMVTSSESELDTVKPYLESMEPTQRSFPTIVSSLPSTEEYSPVVSVPTTDKGMFKSVESIEKKLGIGAYHDVDDHESARLDDATQKDVLSLVPTGVLVRDKTRQWAVQERMKKVIDMESSRDGVELSQEGRQTLDRIREARKSFYARKKDEDNLARYIAGHRHPTMPIELEEPSEKRDVLLADLNKEEDGYLRRVKDLSKNSLKRLLQNCTSPELQDDLEDIDTDSFATSASLDLAPKRKKTRYPDPGMPTSYLILTVSVLMLAVTLICVLAIPDLQEWLEWLWERIWELTLEFVDFLKTDAGKAFMASLLIASVSSIPVGRRTRQEPVPSFLHRPGMVAGETLKDGEKESIKISYKQAIGANRHQQA